MRGSRSQSLGGVSKGAPPHRHHPTVQDWPPWSLGGEERLVDHQRAPQLFVDFADEAAQGVFPFLNLSAGELEEASQIFRVGAGSAQKRAWVGETVKDCSGNDGAWIR